MSSGQSKLFRPAVNSVTTAQGKSSDLTASSMGCFVIPGLVISRLTVRREPSAFITRSPFIRYTKVAMGYWHSWYDDSFALQMSATDNLNTSGKQLKAEQDSQSCLSNIYEVRSFSALFVVSAKSGHSQMCFTPIMRFDISLGDFFLLPVLI